MRGPGIEGEFAVRLSRDVPHPAELSNAPEEFVAAVFPVIELHNSVFRRPRPRSIELIGNNAIHAGVVKGAAEMKPGAGELEISVAVGGKELGRASVDPLKTLGALAQRLAALGISLSRGDILLAGSPLPLYHVGAGDDIAADCSAIGAVKARLTEPRA